MGGYIPGDRLNLQASLFWAGGGGYLGLISLAATYPKAINFCVRFIGANYANQAGADTDICKGGG